MWSDNAQLEGEGHSCLLPGGAEDGWGIQPELAVIVSCLKTGELASAMDLILFGLLASKKVTGEEQQKVPLALNQDCRQRWFPLYSEEKSVLHIPHGFRMKAVMYFT